MSSTCFPVLLFDCHFFLINFQSQPASVVISSRAIDKSPVDELGEIESVKEVFESAEYDEVSSSRPWYFTNGERCPKPARINKKTKKRLAKLIPSEDTRSDRITNQLMFVPPNYDEIKNEGRMKTILLYNGLGPWNVKQGLSVQ